MTNAQALFISEVAPLIQKYAKEFGYYKQVVPAIIAQAICESSWGQSGLAKYHNYFGMKCGSWKGKSVNMATKEEYEVGTLTDIRANFRAYDTREEGIKGYFEFLKYDRYANLKKATAAQQYLEYLKADGYATSSTYVKTNMNIVDLYGLAKYATYDGIEEVQETVQTETVSTYQYYPTCDGYTKGSLIDALKSIGVSSSMDNRKKIAVANGIDGYKGTAEQNKKLLALLKAGKLVRA